MNALKGAETSGIRSSRTLDEALLYVALPVGSASGIQGAVRITYPASVVDDRIRHIWLLLAATGGVVLGIVFLASLLLARSVTWPLGELERAAAALGAGDLAVRAVVPKGPDEVTMLAESFNATAARLEQLVGAPAGVRRRRVASVAHAPRRTPAPAREPRSRRERACGGGSRRRARRSAATLASGRRVARADARRAVDLGPGVDLGRRSPRRTLRRVGRVRGRTARVDRVVGTPRAVRARDTGPARAGRRQPAQQRARGRARRERGATRRDRPATTGWSSE